MVNKRYKWEPRAWMTDRKYFGLPIGENIWEHPTTPREEAELMLAKWQHHFVAKLYESNIYRALSHEDLGEIIGVGADTFERILNGSRPLELIEYVLLCKEFGFGVLLAQDLQ